MIIKPNMSGKRPENRPEKKFNPKSNPDLELEDYLSDIDKNINTLYLFKKKLTKIPESIGEFLNLEYLSLDGNNITNFPKSFTNLKKIKILDLSNNNLLNLPPEIGNLKSLVGLYLDTNQLNDIPLEIKNLKNLRSLRLNNNNFSIIPKVVLKLVNIQHFSVDIDRNPLKSIPFFQEKEIFKRKVKSMHCDTFFFKNKYFYPNLNLTKKGFNLLKNAMTRIEHIERVPNQNYSPTPENLDHDELAKYLYSVPDSISKEFFDVNKREDTWHEEALEELYQYYSLYTTDIARKYIKTPDEVSQDEKERLVHEADFKLRQILENQIEDPANDDVLLQLNERFKVKMQNGFSIYL